MSGPTEHGEHRRASLRLVEERTTGQGRAASRRGVGWWRAHALLVAGALTAVTVFALRLVGFAIPIVAVAAGYAARCSRCGGSPRSLSPDPAPRAGRRSEPSRRRHVQLHRPRRAARRGRAGGSGCWSWAGSDVGSVPAPRAAACSSSSPTSGCASGTASPGPETRARARDAARRAALELPVRPRPAPATSSPRDAGGVRAAIGEAMNDDAGAGARPRGRPAGAARCSTRSARSWWASATRSSWCSPASWPAVTCCWRTCPGSARR